MSFLAIPSREKRPQPEVRKSVCSCDRENCRRRLLTAMDTDTVATPNNYIADRERGSNGDLRVLVLVDAFPVLSQTFVVDHLAGLVENGATVNVVARELDRAGMQRIRGRIRGMQLLLSPGLSLRSILHFLRIVLTTPKVLCNRLLLRCAWHGARLSCLDLGHVRWSAIHAHFANNGLAAVLANKRWLDRLLTNFHGYDATAAPARHGWWPYRELLKSSDAVAHSSFVANLLSENTELRVHRVTMGVDTSHFTARPRARQWPRPLSLLFIGRLVEQKGVQTAIDALALLRRNAPQLDARLSIIGAGPLEAALRQQISALGLQGMVDGPEVSDHHLIATHLAAADILIAPSLIGTDGWQEAFGRVVVEALACGVPVVSFASGGLPETVGRGGIIASGFDATSLSEAVLTLVGGGTPKFWRSRALKQVSEFHIERMNEDYLLATKRVAERHLNG